MPAPRTVRLDQRGMRLGDFLAETWPEADRVFLRRLLRDGLVEVNRMEADARTKLGPGDEVRVSLPDGVDELPTRRPAGAGVRELAVLAENDVCVVVDKPAGLPTVPDRTGRARGVHGLLATLRPDDDLRIAHRLDRDTSGCLVVAKGVEGARWLDHAFRSGAVHKEYLALVEGRVARQRFSVKKALGPDPRRPGKVVTVPAGEKRSREALTDVEVERRFRTHTLLRVHPRTGRGHQIRVHLRSSGHPIVGDADYGADRHLMLSSFKPGYKSRRGVTERPLLSRIFLHAERVVVPMPDGAPDVDVRAPLPEDLSRVLKQMERFATASRRGGPCD